jgi:hypothetical protein
MGRKNSLDCEKTYGDQMTDDRIGEIEMKPGYQWLAHPIGSLKLFLFAWLFSDYVRQTDERLRKHFEAQRETFTSEFQAWMRETRELMRDDYRAVEKERKLMAQRHGDLIDAIRSLKK